MKNRRRTFSRFGGKIHAEDYLPELFLQRLSILRDLCRFLSFQICVSSRIWSCWFRSFAERTYSLCRWSGLVGLRLFPILHGPYSCFSVLLPRISIETRKKCVPKMLVHTPTLSCVEIGEKNLRVFTYLYFVEFGLKVVIGFTDSSQRLFCTHFFVFTDQKIWWFWYVPHAQHVKYHPHAAR